MGKRKKKSKLEKPHGVSDDVSSSNPLLEQQIVYLQNLSEQEREHFFSNTKLDPHRRAEIWMEQADLGETLVNQYSWATPDPRAIRILQHFSPLVEIGCGANAYWCHILKQHSIDIVGYDIRPTQGGKIPNQKQKSAAVFNNHHKFLVQSGDPKILQSDAVKGRTLFLCYADENDNNDNDNNNFDDDPFSMGAQCLEYYQGDYVIHVGELYGDTLSMDQAPWGRSSSPEFQQRLSAEYHCLLRVSLTNWLHVRDTLSVWKRSELCSIVFAGEDEGEDEGEEVQYRNIPQEERLPTNVAAPCLAHLLEDEKEKRTESRTVKVKPKKKVVLESPQEYWDEQDERSDKIATTETNSVPLQSAVPVVPPSEPTTKRKADNTTTPLDETQPSTKKKRKKKRKGKKEGLEPKSLFEKTLPSNESSEYVCPW